MVLSTWHFTHELKAIAVDEADETSPINYSLFRIVVGRSRQQITCVSLCKNFGERFVLNERMSRLRESKRPTKIPDELKSKYSPSLVTFAKNYSTFHHFGKFLS